MRAGTLRHRITIEQMAVTPQDAFGGAAGTWSAVAIRRASIEPLQGRERFAAQQAQAGVDVRIRLRYDRALSSLAPKMRIVFGARVFDIQAVLNPDARNREFELLCTEAVA